MVADVGRQRTAAVSCSRRRKRPTAARRQDPPASAARGASATDPRASRSAAPAAGRSRARRLERRTPAAGPRVEACRLHDPLRRDVRRLDQRLDPRRAALASAHAAASATARWRGLGVAPPGRSSSRCPPLRPAGPGGAAGSARRRRGPPSRPRSPATGPAPSAGRPHWRSTKARAASGVNVAGTDVISGMAGSAAASSTQPRSSSAQRRSRTTPSVELRLGGPDLVHPAVLAPRGKPTHPWPPMHTERGTRGARPRPRFSLS